MDRETSWIARTFPGIDAEGWAGHTVPVRNLVRIERWYEGDTAWLRGTYRYGPIPGWGDTQSIVVGDRVITCADPDVVRCYDANNGKVLW